MKKVLFFATHSFRILFVSGLFVGLSTRVLAQNCSNSVIYQPPGAVVQILSASAVNTFLGGLPPFDTSCPVIESVPTKTSYLVRVYAPNSSSKSVGSYLVNPNFIRNLTPAQIRNVLALPELPTYIDYVKITAGNHGLWTGIAAPIAGWGEGGAVQTKIIGPGASPPSADPNYSRLTPASDFYIDGVPIGAYALSYEQVISSGNAGNVAHYLDSRLPEPYSDAADVYTTLDFINAEDPSDLAGALTQLSPLNFDSYSTVELRNDLLFKTLLLDHADSPQENKPSQSYKGCIASWVDGGGEEGNLKQRAEQVGFNYQTAAFAGGLDCQLQPALKVGFGSAYLYNHLKWTSNNLGNASINNAKLGLYARYLNSGYFINGVLSGGGNWGSSKRNINFRGNGYSVLTDAIVDSLSIDRIARSNQVGQNLGLYFIAGKTLQLNQWRLTPTAQLSYYYAREGSFNEHGADSLNLNVNAFTAQTFASQVELFLGKTLKTSRGASVTADAGVGVANYLPLDNRVISATLPALGGNFNVNGYNSVINTALLSARLNTFITRRLAVSSQYKAELGTGFRSQLVELKCIYGFDK